MCFSPYVFPDLLGGRAGYQSQRSHVKLKERDSDHLLEKGRLTPLREEVLGDIIGHRIHCFDEGQSFKDGLCEMDHPREEKFFSEKTENEDGKKT